MAKIPFLLLSLLKLITKKVPQAEIIVLLELHVLKISNEDFTSRFEANVYVCIRTDLSFLRERIVYFHFYFSFFFLYFENPFSMVILWCLVGDVSGCVRYK